MSSARPSIDMQFRFAEGRTDYWPGDRVLVEAVAPGIDGLDCRAVETSVLWRTVGQGDEDLEIIYFERIGLGKEKGAEAFGPFIIEAELPDSPLSYNGVNVKVCWAVRVRLFLGGFREVVAEAPFRLGSVWSPHLKEAPK